jgi:hypothetical protein
MAPLTPLGQQAMPMTNKTVKINSVGLRIKQQILFMTKAFFSTRCFSKRYAAQRLINTD